MHLSALRVPSATPPSLSDSSSAPYCQSILQSYGYWLGGERGRHGCTAMSLFHTVTAHGYYCYVRDRHYSPPESVRTGGVEQLVTGWRGGERMSRVEERK
ncbi:hypothetical protein AAFF_G00027820 [Aldrovandia affinis]|uniref:Uncharacterized protein n=1 Tax=Aldrovandia affinis TaxID=143900 RepID=A0AAD7S4M6_9TELE|nr:hypothetical protein AAFF_G00027820 [Aldrovandia affinis]